MGQRGFCDSQVSAQAVWYICKQGSVFSSVPTSKSVWKIPNTSNMGKSCSQLIKAPIIKMQRRNRRCNHTITANLAARAEELATGRDLSNGQSTEL